MAGKVKHAQRSMRSYNENKYAFSGFRQFDKKENKISASSGKLGFAILVSDCRIKFMLM